MSHLRAFELIERDLRPGCRQILVEGELDLAVADQLVDGLARAGAECRHLLIGLENCEFIDSTGIAAIVNARNQFAERGGRGGLRRDGSGSSCSLGDRLDRQRHGFRER